LTECGVTPSPASNGISSVATWRSCSDAHDEIAGLRAFSACSSSSLRTYGFSSRNVLSLCAKPASSGDASSASATSSSSAIHSRSTNTSSFSVSAAISRANVARSFASTSAASMFTRELP
jgi:hypothetical protein